MIYGILNLDPKSRAHFSTYVLALRYSFLMYHSYETEIPVSRGFITLWMAEKRSSIMGFLWKFVLATSPQGAWFFGSHRHGSLHHRDPIIVFVLHDFCCLCVLPLKVSRLFFRTCSFVLLIPSWEALHRERAVAKQAFVFRGTVISELLLFPVLETINWYLASDIRES